MTIYKKAQETQIEDAQRLYRVYMEQLIRLIENNMGDSEIADTLRDEMDVYWLCLNKWTLTGAHEFINRTRTPVEGVPAPQTLWASHETQE
jgi:hypothetical protein